MLNLEYNATIALFPQQHERARVRRTVNHIAALREANAETQAARVVDLSEEGCALTGFTALEVGREVWIKLPSRLPLRAEVKWLAGEKAGCLFFSPLATQEIEALTAPRTVQRRVFQSPRNNPPPIEHSAKASTWRTYLSRLGKRKSVV
jgi:hypothetical protein